MRHYRDPHIHPARLNRRRSPLVQLRLTFDIDSDYLVPIKQCHSEQDCTRAVFSVVGLSFGRYHILHPPSAPFRRSARHSSLLPVRSQNRPLLNLTDMLQRTPIPLLSPESLNSSPSLERINLKPRVDQQGNSFSSMRRGRIPTKCS